MDGCCALSLVPVVHKRATYIAYLLPVLVHYYCTFRVHRPGFFLPQKCFTIYVKYTSTRLTVDSYCPYHCAQEYIKIQGGQQNSNILGFYISSTQRMKPSAAHRRNRVNITASTLAYPVVHLLCVYIYIHTYRSLSKRER